MTLVLIIMAFVVIIMLLGVPVGFSFGLGGFAILFITGLLQKFGRGIIMTLGYNIKVI